MAELSLSGSPLLSDEVITTQEPGNMWNSRACHGLMCFPLFLDGEELWWCHVIAGERRGAVTLNVSLCLVSSLGQNSARITFIYWTA